MFPSESPMRTRLAVAFMSLFCIFATSIATAAYRSIDGVDNNIANPDWGAAGSQLLRIGSADYVDGLSVPNDGGLPSARTISNAVSAQSALTPSAYQASDMLWQWGQFLDHDIDLTPANMSDPMPIDVPAGDSHFSGQIPFSRSIYDTGAAGARQQVNTITAFIDASQIYGSDQTTADSLRTFSDGKMKMTSSVNGDLLHMEGGMFAAGDERANEQVGLTAMHTLFAREHNRLAAEIKAANPSFNDETIYQEARKLVGAMVQSITYNEFLPALLGSGAPGAYTGYDETVNPGIANEFSTAAYRFGHSMLSPQLLRLDENGKVIAAGNLPLDQAFFNPGLLLDPANGGIEPVLRGLMTQYAQQVDPMLVDGVRNLLFGPPVDVGFDLAALNLQRGRDHGLPGYNEMRDLMPGLERYLGWDDVDFLPGFKELLMSVYDSVDDIELWVGGLAEAHVNGGLMGELFSGIVSDQFERLRVGDRFWFENDMFESEWMDYVQGSTLSAIIMRNTAISSLRTDVFFAPVPGVWALMLGGLVVMGISGYRRRCDTPEVV